MRTLLLCLLLALACSAIAQRECASTAYLEQLKEDPATRASILAAEQQSSHLPNFRELGEGNSPVIRIPVVVHILYKEASQNISDAQVRSQLRVLNEDFGRRNADTANTPERFRAFAGALPLEFVLATVDPSGRATTGIIRKQTSSTYFYSDDKIKFSSQGGDDAWDSRYYLNIWVGNMRGVLGYSSVPGCATDKDGVVIAASAFGTINTAAPYHLGRTAVHEIGHWLGLKHIWGDTYCGDDGVADTPQQGNFTAGCPSGFRSSCNNNATGDMYMNFMDLTSDACMNLFSRGQRDRILNQFTGNGYRRTILESQAMGQPWNLEPLPVAPVADHDFQAFPNPVRATVQLSFGTDWMGKTVELVNAHGVVVKRITVTSASMPVQLGNLAPGIYFLSGRDGEHRIQYKLLKL